jgi:hypothetical protein
LTGWRANARHNGCWQRYFKLTALGIYDKDILDKYTQQEIEELDAHTDHERDMK